MLAIVSSYMQHTTRAHRPGNISQQLPYRIQEDKRVVVAHVSARTSAVNDEAHVNAREDAQTQRIRHNKPLQNHGTKNSTDTINCSDVDGEELQQIQVSVADDVDLVCIVQNYNSHTG